MVQQIAASALKPSQVNYTTAKLQVTDLILFCYLQLCPAFPLPINIIKDCEQILSFSQNEKTFFDRYLDTGEQGKQPPLSDDFCGVCLKYTAFAYKPLVIAI